MDRYGETYKDTLLIRRLRYVQRDVVYVRRLAPPPVHKIMDIYRPTSSSQPAVSPVVTVPVVTPLIVRDGLLVSDVRSSHWRQFKLPRRWYKLLTPSFGLYLVAGVLLLAGSTVVIYGFRTNQQVAGQVTQYNNTAKAADGDSIAAPSTDHPTSQAMSNYVVAANLPRYIDIPSLTVHARILPMSVKDDSQLKAPSNVYDTGWYNASAQPGQAGAMLVDGHISSWTTKGIFYGIKKLIVGDHIKITRGDDKVFTYSVVSTQIVAADKVDMADLLVSPDTAKPGLNLISCTGDVIPGTNEFNKRVVVRTVLSE